MFPDSDKCRYRVGGGGGGGGGGSLPFSTRFEGASLLLVLAFWLLPLARYHVVIIHINIHYLFTWMHTFLGGHGTYE